MIPRIRTFSITCLAFFTLGLANLNAAKYLAPPLGNDLQPTLVINGDFDGAASQTGIPEHWTTPENSEGKIETLKDNDTRDTFVRLISEAPDQLVSIEQDISLTEDIKGVAFHARFRNENVKFGKGGWLCDARARFAYLDAEGNRVGPKLSDVIFDSHAQVWQVASRDYIKPEGATTFRIALTLNRPASGTLDIDEVRLVPMTEARFQELEATRLAAEQKKAAEAQKKIEDQKIIDEMLAAEPKTRQLGVMGNKVINSDYEPVLLRGVNIVSLEWSAKGEKIHRSVKVALKEWNANVIRLPIIDSFWFGRGKGKQKSNDAEAYRKIVDDVVTMASGEGAYVILDLHRYGGIKESAREFWLDAAARYANNPAVLFDLYNEPHGISWELWRNGGEMKTKDKGTVQLIGMQDLLEAVRSTGARNIVIAGGTGYAYNLKGILDGYALEDQEGTYGLMYATHFYNWHSGWQENFLDVAEKYPVLIGEFGADVKKMSFIKSSQQEDPYTFVPDALGMAQKYNLHFTGFSMHPKATPVLIKDWSYEPTDFWGKFLVEALAGKQFEMKKMR
ncbi:glycoside hydrolase family 5 protein [Cerasicoccus fimbriatus]|uniref:glycoside hydrolase family 5 protein n=1 Tax=Cerasicoccus fimbriatus TaxID=3014554 RepID=UPI0022B2C0CD|nr:glycoside hydrolase family 5 protein [Cerasicoccus sp. TK19100]